MRHIFTADPTTWVDDLGDRIREHLDAGRIVVWRSVSGAALTIANVSVGAGVVETYGIRHCTFDPMVTDGWPLALGRLEATSCGLWTSSGYRSSRPVVVYALEEPGESVSSHGLWADRLADLGSSGEDQLEWLGRVPSGHPQDRCPVAHCPVLLDEPGRT